MFADMKSMVTKAWREQYALLAINCMNLESARAAVRVAEKHRAPIILNLYQGHLADAPRYDHAANADLMTQAADVEPFIQQTGIDLLAVSVGTAHGMYAPGVIPAIDFQRLEEIARLSTVPLALHGGSGTPFDQLQRCPTFGVAKINVGAAVFEAGKAALLHTLCRDTSGELVDALALMEQACEEAIIPYLQASGAIGKA